MGVLAGTIVANAEKTFSICLLIIANMEVVRVFVPPLSSLRPHSLSVSSASPVPLSSLESGMTGHTTLPILHPLTADVGLPCRWLRAHLSTSNNAT